MLKEYIKNLKVSYLPNLDARLCLKSLNKFFSQYPGYIILVVGIPALIIAAYKCELGADVIATYLASLLLLSVVVIANSIDKKDREEADVRKNLAKVEAIKTPINAELENVTVGMITTERLVCAFVKSKQWADKDDFSDNAPRPMPYTENLGSQITLLNKQEVDILATLRANLTLSTETLLNVKGQKIDE